jgi:L-threonylcarbamoyladenylate synthase
MIKKNLIKTLASGGVAVIPTDTIYGLVGSALNQKTVERIYNIRKRNPDKPFIIIISKISDFKKFGIVPNKKTLDILNKFWPGPTSVILPCRLKKFAYLHRGTKTLAFRLPKNVVTRHCHVLIRKILEKTGPLVAPSANLEGLPPAENIAQAKKYFGSSVDFYLNAGTIKKAPSALIKIEKGKIIRLR